MRRGYTAAKRGHCRCPSCESRGYLDHIDPFKRIQYEHCPSCFTKWQLTEDELVALNS